MRQEATNHANRVRNAMLAAIPSPATQTTEMPSFDCRPPQSDPLPAKLPPLFRVESICRLPVDECRHVARAELFHAQAALSVFWVGGHSDTSVARDALVAIRWLGDPFCNDGALRIARLLEIDEPTPTCNLFDTVPRSWSTDRALLKEAAARWLQASRRARQSFNSRHWDAASFQSYLAACGVFGSNQ
jgi:3'-5' exoribonuclease